MHRMRKCPAVVLSIRPKRTANRPTIQAATTVPAWERKRARD
jgi:hypothetical protein